ncbi:MAG: FAD-dependent oxidoreductase, partial [Hyphomicrobium sp.]
MTADVETLVIGAGVIGLACARSLAARGHDVMVLERNDRIGAEISSR